jgi:formate hydrogenlyase subunit 6/NADH:ubiquinone oxidoreductase subunit I
MTVITAAVTKNVVTIRAIAHVVVFWFARKAIAHSTTACAFCRAVCPVIPLQMISALTIHAIGFAKK